MKKELRDKIIAYNKTVNEAKTAKEDLELLLASIPKGRRKQLVKVSEIQAIFEKYGVEVAE